MKNFDFISNDDENVLAEEFSRRVEFIMSLEPSEIVARLEQVYDSTDVILEGYTLMENLTSGDGIASAGLIRLREAVSESIYWIRNYFNLDELPDDEETDLWWFRIRF